MSGLRGCPKVFLNIDFIELLKEAGYSWLQISQVVGTSRTTLCRRLKESGFSICKFSDISDSALDYLIENYKRRNANCGQVMLRGYLSSIDVIVQRRRIRESLARINPLNQMMQHPIRRVYKVPGANSLWHIDWHHKLIRWRFVIHGGIDGFSRMIVYLHCSTNNRSATVMTLFHEAVQKYGLPSRVRSDMGGENILVCYYMVATKGTGRGSHLAGSSTRNQRIERMWRDVFRCVGSTYYNLFHSMEDMGILDPDNEIDLLILHCLYMERINNSLDEFAKAWNKHPVRTVDSWSPFKIWMNSLISMNDEYHSGGDVPDLDNIGIDDEGPVAEEQLYTVMVPDTFGQIDNNVLNIFVDHLKDTAPTVMNYDIDYCAEFVQAKSFLMNLL